MKAGLLHSTHILVISAVISLFLSTSVTGAGLTDGLVAQFPFDGDAKDSGPNGLDGVVYGALTDTDRLGRPNSSLKFTGYGNWVRLNIGPSYFTGDFSLSLWILFADFQAQYPAIIDADTGFIRLQAAGPLYAGEHHYQYVKFYQYQRDCCMTREVWSPSAFQKGVWYHLAIVRTGFHYRMYINGAFAAESVSDVTLPETLTGSYLQVGNDLFTTYGGSWFHGNIDDLAIYSRVLTDSEIQMLASVSGLRVTLKKAVEPSFSGLLVGTNYQLQVSRDVNTWVNNGLAFTATSSNMVYPQYWDVDNWNSLYFRLKVVP